MLTFFSIGIKTNPTNILTAVHQDTVVLHNNTDYARLVIDERVGMFHWELLNLWYRNKYRDFIKHMHRTASLRDVFHSKLQVFLPAYSRVTNFKLYGNNGGSEHFLAT